MKIKNSSFLRFSAIGGIGFIIDSAVLYAMLYVFSSDLYTARVFSYLAAGTFTWLCNRLFTFSKTKDPAPLRQWIKFLAFNAIGGAVNYSVYALAVTFSPFIAQYPIVGVAFGSISGLIFNYNCSRFFVFKSASANRPSKTYFSLL